MKTKLNNPPKYLNVDEFNKLIKNSTLIKLRKNSLKSIYIHLAVVLGLHAGLRVSEMIKLKPKDVTLDAEFQNITIVNSKYNRTRIVPIMDTPLISLLKYLNVEDNTNLNIPYINRSTRQLYNLIEKVYKLSNIEYGGIHQLRQYLLGHSSTSTTRRYIDAEFSSNTSYIKEAFKKMKQFNDNNY